MDFIFMLTRDDQTVADAPLVLDEIADLGIKHLGYKDAGATPSLLAELHLKIASTGAASYLEVVSTSRERALQSAEVAADLGVDYLMGGTWIDETLQVLAGSPTRYLPFVGTPVGHPTRLDGTPELIAQHCRQAEAAGCAGVDLLAHRATQADPHDLVQAARAATTGRLVVAGSITTRAQIEELAAAGVDAFTVGTAAFTGAIDPRRGTLRGQLRTVLDAVQQISADHTCPPQAANLI